MIDIKDILTKEKEIPFKTIVILTIITIVLIIVEQLLFGYAKVNLMRTPLCNPGICNPTNEMQLLHTTEIVISILSKILIGMLSIYTLLRLIFSKNNIKLKLIELIKSILIIIISITILLCIYFILEISLGIHINYSSIWSIII